MTDELIQKLEEVVPGAVLEARPFGRSGAGFSIWVEMRAIAKVARALRADPAFSFDQVENFAVMELEGALVFTYWLRSSLSGVALILRGSLELPKGKKVDDLVELDSVAGVWPSAIPQEIEMGELFGLRFRGLDPAAHGLTAPGFASGASGVSSGFPLRKSYVFPTEIDGRPHMRRLTPSAPAASEVLP